MGKFIIKKGKKGLRFDLKAANGLIVASGDDFFADEAAAKKAVKAWQKNVASAKIEDQTLAEFKKEKGSKFEIYKDSKNNFRFRLKAGNGQVLAVSEAYKRKPSAVNGIKSVVKNSADAEIVFEEAAPKKAAPKAAAKPAAKKPAAKKAAPKKPAAKKAAPKAKK